MTVSTEQISLTTSECDAIVYQEEWVTVQPPGCHMHSRNANRHISAINQLNFIILVTKIWFSGMLNPFQGLKNSLIITKTQKPRWLPILTKNTKNMYKSLSTDL